LKLAADACPFNLSIEGLLKSVLETMHQMKLALSTDDACPFNLPNRGGLNPSRSIEY